MKRFAVTPLAGFLAWAFAISLASGVLATQAAAQGSQEERLQRLEEHMLDLNSMIGTLQSLVNQNAAGAGTAMTPPEVPMAQPGAFSAGDGQRLDAMETQIRALTGQIEQMSQQISRLQGGNGADQLPSQQGLRGAYPDQQQQTFTLPDQGSSFGQASGQPDNAGQQQAYGTQSYGASQPDIYGNQPSNPQASPQGNPWQQNTTSEPPQVAAVPSADSQAAYETAYNQLLRREFSAAEEGFREFLRAHPNDPLAGNAQYWLGETYYVRGQFREAADSFLAGYRNYRNSDKAPANLLKLGMALHRLGEKDAACSTFSELGSKFPDAPSHLKQRASAERERSGC